MLTKTIIALSLIAGSTFALASYSQSPKLETSLNPLQITQLPQQIDSIAQNITVKVYDAQNESSGILITKDNNTYTVITNANVTDATFREVAFSIPIQNIANLSPQLADLVPGSNPNTEQPEVTDSY